MDNDSHALDKHVTLFSKDGFFSPSSVDQGLSKVKATKPGFKGTFISGFNSAHTDHCPFSATKLPVTPSEWSKFLHLETTRIWNSEGGIDEERWQAFVAEVIKGQEQQDTKIVTHSALKHCLQTCFKTDKEEANTGRRASNLLSSTIQATAASQAWDEVYNRLTTGWKHDELTDEYEPYIDLALLRLFFEDSEAAFQKAETGELPVAKPESTKQQRSWNCSSP